MRAIFGILSLLIVVAVVGLLAKKQLAGAQPPVTGPGQSAAGVAAPAGTPQQQVRQVQQAVQGAMQQPRPMPDEK